MKKKVDIETNKLVLIIKNPMSDNALGIAVLI